MAVSLYVGPPGSGKSYEAISSVVLPAFKQGRHVVTNIKGVRPDYWRATIEPDKGRELGTISVVDEEFFNDELNYPLMSRKGEVLGDGAVQPGALLVIDEAYLVFPTGPVYADDKEREAKGGGGVTKRMVEFIRTHRHFVSPDGVASDVVLISQDVMSLHPRIRAVAEFVATIRNMRHLGLAKRYRVNVYNSAKCTKASAIGESHRKYNLEIFKLYKSFEAEGAAKVVLTDKSHRAFKWYHAFFLVSAFGALAYAFMGVDDARDALSAKGLTAALPGRAVEKKKDCAGSGVLVDLTGRRAFVSGQWRAVGETVVGVDGRTRWDVGPCWLRFG